MSARNFATGRSAVPAAKRAEPTRGSYDELVAEVREYETRYRTPSAHLADAFRVDGELRECQELYDWSAKYKLAHVLSLI